MSKQRQLKVDLAKAKRCVVCGAKVLAWNPLTNACDPICTRAKHNGTSREEQIMLDIEEERKLKKNAK